jgi:hypothetical protein
MKRYTIFCVFTLLILLCQNSSAQIQAGAFIGFKSIGLKNTAPPPTTDGGGTVFDFGGFGGYTVFGSGIYNLDLQASLSYSSIGFVERGYNSAYGAGKFSTNGYSGGTTSIIEVAILGLNRLSIPSMKVVEPYAGAGLSFNLLSTGDITYQGGSVKGNSQLKLGLVIAYGAILHVTPLVTPFIQLKHLIPFGSETRLTDDPNGQITVNDVPGYFALSAGVRFGL